MLRSRVWGAGEGEAYAVRSNALWVMVTWGAHCEQTDTCENITLPPLRWQVKITIQNLGHVCNGNKVEDISLVEKQYVDFIAIYVWQQVKKCVTIFINYPDVDLQQLDLWSRAALQITLEETLVKNHRNRHHYNNSYQMTMNYGVISYHLRIGIELGKG